MVAASRQAESYGFRRRRWADVGDGSDDEPEDQFSFSSAPVAEDSYREAPLASLEDSRKGLNSQLSSSNVGPKDFTFLLESCEEDKASLSWRPNLEAPEFIPTLSMACPLVGICHAEEVGNPSPCDDDNLSTASTSRSTPAKNKRGPATISEFGTTPEKTLQAQSGILSTPTNGKNRKRRPPTLQLQDFGLKRTKSEERKEERKVVSPAHSTGSSTTRRASSRQRHFSSFSETSSCQSEATTEATEEDLQHRAEVRSKAIAVGKATAEYQRYISLKAPASRQDGEPLTPNPLDRSISKRAWKFNVGQWRNALLKYAVNHEAV